MSEPARKTHLFACAYCRYTTEIGPSEPVQCPHCHTNAGTYRILDSDEVLALGAAPNPA